MELDEFPPGPEPGNLLGIGDAGDGSVNGGVIPPRAGVADAAIQPVM